MFESRFSTASPAGDPGSLPRGRQVGRSATRILVALVAPVTLATLATPATLALVATCGIGASVASDTGDASTPSWPVSEGLPPEARQFDFWVGRWDVNLRVRQKDGTWRDTHRADAKIYPILSGKAILELWDSPRIKGYSLRYFDPSANRWMLWLNWPGKGRAGSSSLQGAFRHGRGEFFSRSPRPDGQETIARYTFSDVTPTSLRWDDAYSKDSGETWTHNWIMEFSRTEDRPRLALGGGAEHTYHEAAWCTSDGFAALAPLAEARDGTADGEDVPDAGAAALRAYRVLAGCAALVFVEWPEGGEVGETFAHITYNTAGARPELTWLDDRPGTPARVLYGEEGSTELTWHEPASERGPAERVRLAFDDGAITWIEERATDAGSWATVRRARFAGE